MILLHFCLEFGSFWGLFDNNIDLKMSFLKEIGISVVFNHKKIGENHQNRNIEEKTPSNHFS